MKKKGFGHKLAVLSAEMTAAVTFALAPVVTGAQTVAVNTKISAPIAAVPSAKSSQALTIDGKTQSYEKWRQYFLQNPDKKDEMLGKIPRAERPSYYNYESAIRKQETQQVDQALNQGGERIEEKKQALNQQNSDERGIDQALNQGGERIEEKKQALNQSEEVGKQLDAELIAKYTQYIEFMEQPQNAGKRDIPTIQKIKDSPIAPKALKERAEKLLPK